MTGATVSARACFLHNLSPEDAMRDLQLLGGAAVAKEERISGPIENNMQHLLADRR